MSNGKMKGLLKGLRYISHIFENEKEPEIQIGYPTDVKHVAHIGWDGGSVNRPSWMNKFKTPTGFQSAPIAGGLNNELREESSVKWVSQDSARRGQGTQGGKPRDLPGLPKASRHRLASPPSDSPTKEKPKRRSEGNSKSRKPKEYGGGDHPSDAPKKSRRRRSKESNKEGSSRSSRRTRGSEGDASESGYLTPVSSVDA